MKEVLKAIVKNYPVEVDQWHEINIKFKVAEDESILLEKIEFKKK
jgi:hypothetical protein